jgi:hypothetical protein
MYAQPLYVRQATVGGPAHNVSYIHTFQANLVVFE